MTTAARTAGELELAGRRSLSVSGDKLGTVAMRCALLQERFAAEAREVGVSSETGPGG